MHAQSQDDQVKERTLSVDDYALSTAISLHIGARWGHCYENCYPAFFAFPQIFAANGHFVEGWIVFEDQDNVVLMEHGFLMCKEQHIVDPTIVLTVDPGVPVYYFSGVLRAGAELDALENELFPHVHFSGYGEDGMNHPVYRAAYEAAKRKAGSLLTTGKTFVEVKAKMLTAEEEMAAREEAPEVRIILLPPDQGGNPHGENAYELMLRRVHAVVRAARVWKEFETAERFTLSVENEPYMPLVIESWPASDSLQGERRRVLVAHYYIAGERQYPDPELEMTDNGFPIRLRQTVFGIMETPVLWRDPQTQEVLVNRRAKNDIAELLRIWAKNIYHQGFADAASRIITATRPPIAALSPGTEQGAADERHLRP